jgi:hypothetical protein
MLWHLGGSDQQTLWPSCVCSDAVLSFCLSTLPDICPTKWKRQKQLYLNNTGEYVAYVKKHMFFFVSNKRKNREKRKTRPYSIGWAYRAWRCLGATLVEPIRSDRSLMLASAAVDLWHSRIRKQQVNISGKITWTAIRSSTSLSHWRWHRVAPYG